jgi:hypothetical protein
MTLLIYCVFRPSSVPLDLSLAGVDDHAVFPVECGGLAAAVSMFRKQGGNSDFTGLLVYEKVIGFLHRSSATGGVIPMRFGNLADGELQVRRNLIERSGEYGTMLREVAGCEEMGIRLLLPSPPVSACRTDAGPMPEDGAGRRENFAGTNYLADRRLHYTEREGLARERDRLAEKCHSAFSGLCVKWKAECRTVRDPQTGQLQILLSLFFLVPRSNLPSFRRKYRKIHPDLPERVLLSGPWPPYNFVLSDSSKTRFFAASSEKPVNR